MAGVRLNGSSVITYYNKDSKIKFLDNTPGVFKPGLPYTAYVGAFLGSLLIYLSQL